MSVDEFEDKYFSILKQSKDAPASETFLIKDIFSQVWQLYDDLDDDYFRQGKYELSEIDRYICFLRSNMRYEWPRVSRPGRWLLILLSFGMYNKILMHRLKKVGDISVWPFMSKGDYISARTKMKDMGDV
jgi:hypothetical protein